MTVNDTEYQVINLLGKGKGGYSYLVSDGQRNYVIKQIHHEPCDYYQFGDKLESELHDYNRLKSIGIPMPLLLDVDSKKERILKEYICGDTVFHLILRDQMEPTYLQQIRDMSEQLFQEGLNIDYFPTNFIVQKNRLFYVDYECNEYMEKWNFQNWGQKYWSKTKEFVEYVSAHSSF